MTDWKPTRLKSEPDESLVGLCKDVPGQIGVLYGIPNVLTSGSGSETQTREAFRRFVLTAIEPLARIVSVELTRVFEQPIELDLSQLAHADIAGRARAFKALVASGMQRRTRRYSRASRSKRDHHLNHRLCSVHLGSVGCNGVG